MELEHVSSNLYIAVPAFFIRTILKDAIAHRMSKRKHPPPSKGLVREGHCALYGNPFCKSKFPHWCFKLRGGGGRHFWITICLKSDSFLVLLLMRVTTFGIVELNVERSVITIKVFFNE